MLSVATPNHPIIIRLIPSHHHLNHCRSTDFLFLLGQVELRAHRILFRLQYRIHHHLRGCHPPPPRLPPTAIRPLPLLSERHILNMNPPLKLPNRSPYHVHGMPKFRVEMRGAEDPRPRKSTVLITLKRREDRMRNPVVQVLLRQDTRARMEGRKSPLVQFWPRALYRPHPRLQVGHTTHSLKKGGRMKSGRFRRFTGGSA